MYVELKATFSWSNMLKTLLYYNNVNRVIDIRLSCIKAKYQPDLGLYRGYFMLTEFTCVPIKCNLKDN